jgi:hypothetical protein
MLRRTQHANDIRTVRRRAEQFLHELATENYRTHAGLSDTSNVAAIYDRYADLASEPLFNALRAQTKRAKDDDERRAAYLAAFVGRLIAGARTKELVDEQNALEARGEVVYPWGREPYRQSAVTLTNEADADRRRTMAHARRAVVNELTPLARAIIDAQHATTRGLSFPSYTRAVEEIDRLDLGAVHDATRTFLRETDALHEREMSAAVGERLGQRLDQTAKCDAGYLWRAPEFDAMFPADRIVPTAERAVRGLGLDIYAGGHVHLDIAARPKKSPRAFTTAIEVPGRIMLVITPAGGQDDWHAFFHELGHALHYGYVDTGLDFEFRRLGDHSVTESFAFLLEHLLLERAFLDEHLPHELGSAYLRHAARALLFTLRRYCAKLDYELVLHDTDSKPSDADLAAAYAEKLSSATRVAYDPADYLVDVDPGFYCACYLRAWFFEAAFVQYLAREYGEKWFATREAGEFLRSLWSDGQRRRVDELETQLGLPHADPAPLIARLSAHLS